MGVQDNGKDSYGRDTISANILAEVGLISYRVDNHDERKNNEAMCLQLDLLAKVWVTVE